MSLPELAEKMSAAPARILNLEGGEIKAGAPADITIADLAAKYVIDGEKFISKGKNTPFNGTEVYGKITYTIVGGDVKYSAV